MSEISKMLEILHKVLYFLKALPIKQKRGLCKNSYNKMTKYNSPYTIPQTSSIPLVV